MIRPKKDSALPTIADDDALRDARAALADATAAREAADAKLRTAESRRRAVADAVTAGSLEKTPLDLDDADRAIETARAAARRARLEALHHERRAQAARLAAIGRILPAYREKAQGIIARVDAAWRELESAHDDADALAWQLVRGAELQEPAEAGHLCGLLSELPVISWDRRLWTDRCRRLGAAIAAHRESEYRRQRAEVSQRRTAERRAEASRLGAAYHRALMAPMPAETVPSSSQSWPPPTRREK
jgi:hypothetical protein